MQGVPSLLATADRIAALPGQAATEAFVGLVDRLTDVFHLNLAELLLSDNPEPVHKARVALRRLRACLVAFEPIVDGDLSEAMQDRSRTLFRLLGNIRDADVMAIRFADTARAATLTEEAQLQRLKGRKYLKRKKADAFRAWALRRLDGKRWRATGKKAKALRSAPVQVLAIVAMDRAWEACLSNGPDLQVMSARAQHDLRKDLKAIRYLTEFFADLWPGSAQDRFLATLRRLQDDLGEMTDSALAASLGHQDAADTVAPQSRAAEAWNHLQSEGPWWGTSDAEA